MVRPPDSRRSTPGMEGPACTHSNVLHVSQVCNIDRQEITLPHGQPLCQQCAQANCQDRVTNVPHLAGQGMQGNPEPSQEHSLAITRLLRCALCQWHIAGPVVLGSHRRRRAGKRRHVRRRGRAPSWCLCAYLHKHEQGFAHAALLLQRYPTDCNLSACTGAAQPCHAQHHSVDQGHGLPQPPQPVEA